MVIKYIIHLLNIEMVLKIDMAMPYTICRNKRHFLPLKRVKTLFGSCLHQDKLDYRT